MFNRAKLGSICRHHVPMLALIKSLQKVECWMFWNVQFSAVFDQSKQLLQTVYSHSKHRNYLKLIVVEQPSCHLIKLERNAFFCGVQNSKTFNISRTFNIKPFATILLGCWPRFINFGHENMTCMHRLLNQCKKLWAYFKIRPKRN